MKPLEELPRNLRLRKIEKIFEGAENRLCMAAQDGGEGIFTKNDLDFFANTAGLLANDALFPPDARELFSNAAAAFSAQAIAAMPCDAANLRRALNGVKHLLLAATGRTQSDWDFTGADGQLDPSKRRVFKGMHVYLEDIRSPFNVGSMFRTAESFGAEKIFISPFCADPLHRRSLRTAMGCVQIVPWERKDIFSAPENSICPVFALETGGVPISEFPFPRRGLLIAGSEELGVSPLALAAADASLGRVSIPCYGSKGSLNVSTAFGIAMQSWAQAVQSIEE